MKRVMIQYDNGLWVPKDMCTIDRFGEADDCASCKEVCEDLDGDCEECPVQGIFNRLAEYEDLEEQGKLIKLPCKVGDKVYVRMQSGILAEGEVRDFSYFLTCGFCVVVTSTAFDKQHIPFGQFGKTVFLFPKEAE